jgi:soluble lytic murein transglycosylase
MSPPAATVTQRRRTPAGRRAAVRRRRAALLTGIGVAVVAIAIVLAMPLFRKAVNELTLPLSYSSVIRQQAAAKHVPPDLIAAVIYAETKFDPRPSSAGAEGLMQILPATAEFLARRSGATTFTVADLATPSVNIAYGSYYLRYLLDRYNNQEMLALAAYNGGETNVDQWLARARRAGRPLSIDQIPFPQTRAYVLKVLQAQRDYRHTYPTQLGYS